MCMGCGVYVVCMCIGILFHVGLHSKIVLFCAQTKGLNMCISRRLKSFENVPIHVTRISNICLAIVHHDIIG